MPIEVAFDGRRADIVLKRPEVLNALDWAMFDSLAEAVDEVAAARDVRVVVVAGAGRSFCSGIDTSAFGELAGGAAEMIARAQAGFRKLAALEVPTIAAVQGHALGAGLQLALMCDLRVVTADASLGLLEAKYGIVPDLGGTQRLPALVGPARAKKMIWLGERIDGRAAETVGLADEVTEPDGLADASGALAQRVAAAPPLVVRAVKELVDGAPRWSVQQGMDEEGRHQQQLLASNDFSEAIGAYMQRRAPDFTGT